MEFLAFTLYFSARIALTLNNSLTSSTIIGCFQKVNIEGFNY